MNLQSIVWIGMKKVKQKVIRALYQKKIKYLLYAF